jgi:hypothetical protein
MIPIETECFVVTRFGQVCPLFLTVDIAQVPYGVRQRERLIKVAIKRD